MKQPWPTIFAEKEDHALTITWGPALCVGTISTAGTWHIAAGGKLLLRAVIWVVMEVQEQMQAAADLDCAECS